MAKKTKKQGKRIVISKEELLKKMKELQNA